MRFCFLEIAVKGTVYPKTMGNFKKQNFDDLLANLSSRMTGSHDVSVFANLQGSYAQG